MKETYERTLLNTPVKWTCIYQKTHMEEGC